MLVKSASFCVTLCLALFFRTEAKSGFVNNAYQNVAVTFSSRLSPEDGNHLVDSLQKILNEASSVLQTAIGVRIGSVTFHLPHTWNSSAFPNLSYVSSYSNEFEPDIRVNSLTDSAFGKRPIAFQYGGCGVPALDISIPNEFLMAEEEDGSYSKGKILAREWLKYRYGVFDENGFLDDPMYPTHYSIHGSDEIHVTDCTSPKLSYSFRDSENNSCVLTSETATNCSIQPNKEDIENVTSSIMFYHEELQQLEHICGKEGRNHNVGSLNKQNLICSYKSIWEVLQLHEDFKATTEPSDSENAEIEYSFVQESELRLVVAWQDTMSLNEKEKGNTIIKVIRKLLYDIPGNSKAGLYNFKGDSLTTVVDFSDISQTKFESWAAKSNFGSQDEGKPLIALQKGIEVLQANNEDGKPGTIVMFTASDPEDNSVLVDELKKSEVCLTVIGLKGASKDAWSKFFNASACSSFLEIQDSDDPLEMYGKLYNAVEPIISSATEDSKIDTVSIQMLLPKGDLDIPVNPRAKSYTVWIYHDVDLECIANETAISLTEGAQSSHLNSYTFEAQNNPVKCNLKNILQGSYITHVQMTTMEGEYLNNKVFFIDTTPADSKEQMPFIIFAKIFYGEYPVRDADVRAEVTTPDGNVVNLQLVDDGRGEPDITQNDGIYSKYFFKFDSAGTYQVKISAMDNKRAHASKNGQDPCCGSVIVSDSFELSEFQWTHETSFQTELTKPENGYKPSRVTDLRVDSWNLPDSFTLKWTAPGEEMDEGNASNYEFVMFCQHQDCHADGILPKWISFPTGIKPKDSGNEESVTVKFSENKPKNITVYLALKTTNKYQLVSEDSNRIYLKLPRNSQEPTTPETIHDKEPPNTYTAGNIVAYVIIAIAILLLICGIVYFLMDRTKRRRAFEELNTPAAFKCTDSSGDIFSFKSVAPPANNSLRPAENQNRLAENPIRRAESIPVVLYTHDQIKGLKDKTKDPPLYSTNVSPKPWASLNALIDENGSASTNSTVNVGAGSNPSVEIRQLDDRSFTTIPLHEKNSRF